LANTLNATLTCIVAAQANALAALPVAARDTPSPGGLPSLGRDALLRRLNLHFRVDDLRDPAGTVSDILDVYNNMRRVFTRPGGLWGAAIFAPDPLGRAVRAYTPHGGFFRRGEKDPQVGIRNDTIYLCQKLEQDTADYQTITVLHELAHFVSPLSGSKSIIDHRHKGSQAQGWVDSPPMQRLTAAQRVTHAESYANFAFDCAFDRKACGCN
jgi:hypothetical protein